MTLENVRQAADLSEIRGLKREMRPARRESQTALGPLALLLLWPAIFLAACSTAPMPPPTVTHVVLLWLKHTHRATDRDKIVRMAHSLRRIPGVLQVEAGRSIGLVGPNPPRDFDLGVVITFRDRAALQRYERDPRHREAMRRYLDPLVRRYEVYNLVGR
jgi:Stress responsive A/B Barrel Domain